jgi:hypothetical protein
MATTADELREEVRRRYAESARAVTEGNPGDCGCGSGQTGHARTESVPRTLSQTERSAVAVPGARVFAGVLISAECRTTVDPPPYHPRRHARTRAITRDTVFPANRDEWGLEDASRDVARVVSDVSVLCPRTVVRLGNSLRGQRQTRDLRRDRPYSRVDRIRANDVEVGQKRHFSMRSGVVDAAHVASLQQPSRERLGHYRATRSDSQPRRLATSKALPSQKPFFAPRQTSQSRTNATGVARIQTTRRQ